jgi:divalent metal cation (Fe/Co/Zn/Cd) transporter
VDGNLPVNEGDQIASRVEALLCDNIPNLRRVHVHYHPSDKDHQDMTIDQILAEARRKVADYHPQYFD